MAYSLSGDGVLSARMRRVVERARNPLPATREWGEKIAREARRRAPRGRSRGMASLAASLEHDEPSASVTVLTSDKVYAEIQQYGGEIRAGGGVLHARLLVIPLNDDARRMLDGMGAGQSLRTQELVFVRSRRGRMFLIRPGRKGKGRGSKRRHRFAGGQILFMLVPRVQLRPNPAPDGYAPRVSEARVREWAATAVRRHLKG